MVEFGGCEGEEGDEGEGRGGGMEAVVEEDEGEGGGVERVEKVGKAVLVESMGLREKMRAKGMMMSRKMMRTKKTSNPKTLQRANTGRSPPARLRLAKKTIKPTKQNPRVVPSRRHRSPKISLKTGPGLELCVWFDPHTAITVTRTRQWLESSRSLCVSTCRKKACSKV